MELAGKRISLSSQFHGQGGMVCVWGGDPRITRYISMDQEIETEQEVSPTCSNDLPPPHLLQ